MSGYAKSPTQTNRPPTRSRSQARSLTNQKQPQTTTTVQPEKAQKLVGCNIKVVNNKKERKQMRRRISMNGAKGDHHCFDLDRDHKLLFPPFVDDNADASVL